MYFASYSLNKPLLDRATRVKEAEPIEVKNVAVILAKARDGD